MAEDSKPAPAPADAQLATVTLALIVGRREGATICPCEVARAVAGDDEAAWRAPMPRVREVAARLADAGVLRVLQRGRDVDARAARGAIRLGRPNDHADSGNSGDRKR